MKGQMRMVWPRRMGKRIQDQNDRWKCYLFPRKYSYSSPFYFDYFYYQNIRKLLYVCISLYVCRENSATDRKYIVIFVTARFSHFIFVADIGDNISFLVLFVTSFSKKTPETFDSTIKIAVWWVDFYSCWWHK